MTPFRAIVTPSTTSELAVTGSSDSIIDGHGTRLGRVHEGRQHQIAKTAVHRMSVKWVDVSKERGSYGKLVVVPESAAVIQSTPEKPLNFIAVYGPARQGKSFLQGALMRNDSVFKVSPAAKPCTSGVDVSRSTLTLEEFNGSSDFAGSSSTVPRVGFLDVEGSGAEDPAHNLKLAIPPLVLSKVSFGYKHVPRRMEVSLSNKWVSVDVPVLL